MAKQRKQDKVGAPKGNKNAEKWTLATATKLFDDLLKLSYDEEMDYMPSIYAKLMVTKDQVEHLLERFPELSDTYKLIKQNCEVHCYTLGKKAKGQAMFIFNLKNNYGWNAADKIESTNKNENVITWVEEKTYKKEDK